MGKVNNFIKLDIKLSKNEYPVYIGNNLLVDKNILSEQVRFKKAFIVTNSTIAKLYLSKLMQSLASFAVDYLILEDGEQFKNQHSLFQIYDSLISKHHHNDTTIFALGGGVIGDIAALAASTYQRGVRLIHLPTTLLAQVDSSIGGKTAINHQFAKNMIGSFYHPHAVIMDLDTLKTLPNREFRSGFAEIIKYGLLLGGDFLKTLPDIFDADFSDKYISLLTSVIAKSCVIKADIVLKDEREEKGLRHLLNLGHTFAHALESMTCYQRWLHGEAVAIGLYLAALLSHTMGIFSKDNLYFVDSLLFKASLPARIPKDIDVELLQKNMLNDKKIKNNLLSFILIRDFGDCYLETNVTAADLKLALSLGKCS